MKPRIRNLSLAFTATSRDYITKESVKRANERLIRSAAVMPDVGLQSIYEKHAISRPTHEQIVSAASRAMRKMVTADS